MRGNSGDEAIDAAVGHRERLHQRFGFPFAKGDRVDQLVRGAQEITALYGPISICQRGDCESIVLDLKYS